MDEILKWFLAMLYWNEQVLPRVKRQGGSPTLYEEIMEAWLSARLVDAESYEHEKKACATLLEYYQVGRKRLKAPFLPNLRRLLAGQVPVLVIERSGRHGTALFTLTDEGRKQAEAVVKEMSEECSAAVRGTLMSEHERRRHPL